MKPVAWMLAVCAALAGSTGAAFAGPQADWMIWHQPAASDMMARIEWFDLYTLYFIVPITIFVMLLLLIVIIKFRASANPVPSRTTHNFLVEVIWTLGPVIVLIMIAFPSFDLLNRQLAPEEEPSMTLKMTGYQWYWGYEYQDGGELSFDSVILREEDRAESGKTDKSKYPRLLAVDNEVVVPVNEMVRVLVTAADVIHAFAMPAFGIKIDAIPGRVNETWFKADREGLFYGQCSEICGKDHAFMPIAIRVVSQARYDVWKAAALENVEQANRDLMAAIDADKAQQIAGN